MNKIERIALWVIVVTLVAYAGVMTAVVSGELKQVNSVLVTLVATDTSATGSQPNTDLQHKAQNPKSVQVGIASVYAISDTVVMTVTVSSFGPGDLLYEPPVLQVGNRNYPITGESLEKARFAFLDLVTKGQASTQLAFTTPSTSAETWLVFNPNRQLGDVIAPQVRVLMPKPVALPTATPKKKP